MFSMVVFVGVWGGGGAGPELLTGAGTIVMCPPRNFTKKVNTKPYLKGLSPD
jgi:hypothetical protein